MRELCAVAFQPGGTVWKLLKDDPDRYIYDAVRAGADEKLPPDVAAGIADVSKRGGWNRPAAEGFALPTETWREHVARRQRCHELRAKLGNGQVTAVNDLVTLNLDIVRFVTDVIEECEGPELLRAVYQTLTKVTVLDPTCGSGAFLFAALNILEPLYDSCLERMQDFVNEADAKPQAASRERYTDFRDVLKEAERHPNRRYFIFRSVVVNNLYGVDIMDEAVEICKLRLFLKLVSQVENPKDIEPLPDIDFNIRPGNTLVGFARVDDARKAMTAGLDYTDEATKLEKELAELASYFNIFRDHQTRLQEEPGKDKQLALSWSKQFLRKRLREASEKLDGYLAGVYGVDPDDEKAYRKWHDSHKPFHWFAEFYGIMSAGGFDVVIGNPPYVQLSEIDSYRLLPSSTLKCGNLYAVVLERCGKLTHSDGRQGYIVPVSSISTDGYSSLQTILRSRFLCYSSFDDRPSRLFDGLEHIRLSIHLIGSPCSNPALTSTQYNKWNKDEREDLFEKLAFTPSRLALVEGTFPKLFHPLEAGILKGLERQGRTLAECFSKTGRDGIFYSRKVGYFLQVLDFQPEVRDGKDRLRDPSEFKALQFASKAHADLALCCLNSNLFYWFVTAFSDCRHLNKREIDRFPVDLEKLAKSPLCSELRERVAELMKSLKRTSEKRTMRFKHDTLTVQCIIPKHSKPIIDEIDGLLAKHYGFTAEELDFIVNYDIKYRLGAEGADDDEE